MDLEDYTRITSEDDASMINYFQQRVLLRRQVHCSRCDRDYTMIKLKSCILGYVLKCPACKSKTKLTSDTMFEGSKLNLRKLLGLIYMWPYSVTVSTTTTMLGVSSATTV